MGGRRIIITCEHAGNYVPRDYQAWFDGAGDVLASHRGWDPGAFGVAKYLARHLEAPLYAQKVSRLIVDANRSVGSKELFSEFTQKAGEKVMRQLVYKYHYTYRKEVEAKLKTYISGGDAVLHLSIHSFTPVLNDVVRSVDLGILFDDKRDGEREFCTNWKLRLEEELPEMLTMLNCPYHGADDGFTTYLRTKFNDQQYLGVEFEINQKYVDTSQIARIKSALVHSLADS